MQHRSFHLCFILCVLFFCSVILSSYLVGKWHKDEEEAEEISTYTNVIDRCIRSYS